jgi:hypothetical protein
MYTVLREITRIWFTRLSVCYASHISVFHFIEKKLRSNMEEQNFELRALMEYNSAEEFFDSDRYMLIDFN